MSTKQIAEDPGMSNLYAADGSLDDTADALTETIVVYFETDEFGEVEAVAKTSELEL